MVCALGRLSGICTDSLRALSSSLGVAMRPAVAEEDVPSTQVAEGKKEPKKRKKKGDDDEEGEGEGEGEANEDVEPIEKKAKAVRATAAYRSPLTVRSTRQPAKKRAPKKAKKEEDDEENADGDAEEKPAP